jgi:hypothetical protein
MNIDFFSAEQLKENYENFRKRVNLYFKDNTERLDALNKMYDHFEERMVFTPASSTDYFHNAFPGGYIDHVMRVVDNCIIVYKSYVTMGFDMSKISKETLLFSAMHHDLGKLGSVDEDLYILNDSDWHVKNQGKIYKTNPNINFMDLNTRTFYLLNYFGIKCSEDEWLGIKLTDGLYDEDNKKYLITYNKNNVYKTDMPHILHHADLCAARFELERWQKWCEEND